MGRFGGCQIRSIALKTPSPQPSPQGEREYASASHPGERIILASLLPWGKDRMRGASKQSSGSGSAHLRAMPQKVIREHERNHRFPNRHCADAYARIVPGPWSGYRSHGPARPRCGGGSGSKRLVLQRNARRSAGPSRCRPGFRRRGWRGNAACHRARCAFRRHFPRPKKRRTRNRRRFQRLSPRLCSSMRQRCPGRACRKAARRGPAGTPSATTSTMAPQEEPFLRTSSR